MSDIMRVNELPQVITRKGVPPLWKAMVEAYKEGYQGWLKINVATENVAVKLGSNLRYYAKRMHVVKLELRRRRIANGTYDLYGRLVKKDGDEPFGVED